MKSNFLYVVLFLGFTLSLSAQNPVTSSVDSTKIKIGSAFDLTIKTQTSEGDKVVFPDVKNIGPFEVIESSAIDTVLENRKMELIKKYTLTQFDSGKYTVPRLSILVNGKNYQTNLFDVEVTNVKVDTLKQKMYDIKSNMGSTTDTSSLIYYIIVLILCIAVGFAVYWFIKKQQSKNLTEDDLFKTPLEKVSKKLQLLDGKRLIMNGDIKSYYSEITDITREYIEEVFEIPAKESTTSDLIKLLLQAVKTKKIKLSKEIIHDLKRVLETADLVKFAKSEPSYNEIENDRKKTETISISIDKALPKFAEEQSERVRLRERRYRKRKQMRTWIPIGVSALLLLITGGVYLFNSVKDGLEIDFFQSNKRLLKGEWVSSEYGFPGIVIETPEVLNRLELPNTTKKNKEENTAQFVYANAKTNLSITVHTTATQTDENTNAEDLMDQKLKMTEQILNAKDFKSDSEKFTLEGINGIRSSGTFEAVNPLSGKNELMQFEMYLFIQKNGIQEVAIMYNQGDEYGAKIAQRIVESIQLSVQTNE